jgi:hypothetical protein
MTFSKTTKYSLQVWILVNLILILCGLITEALFPAEGTFDLNLFLVQIISILILNIISFLFFKKIVQSILQKKLTNNIKKLLLVIIGIIFFITIDIIIIFILVKMINNESVLIEVYNILTGIYFLINIMATIISFILVITVLPLPNLAEERLDIIDHLIS